MKSKISPKALLASLAVFAALAAGAADAGPLAPQPRVVAKYDRNFIERSGAQTLQELLDTGIIRYFLTGGQNLLVLVDGRPYSSTGGNLESVPLSAVERIEVLAGDSLGSIGGTVRGALNIVLRKSLDGFETRTVTRAPSRDGGDAWQGSVFWGGGFGEGGRMTLGVDVLDRQEIPGSERVHSRSEWVEGGSFSQARNVSRGGNTAYVVQREPDASVPGGFRVTGQRSVALGTCDPAQGYTGVLSNPPGITSGDKGCGFAFGDIWWDTASYEQQSAILDLDHPLGDDAELYLDVNIRQGDSAFRYAPSVGGFSLTRTPETEYLINEINRTAGGDFEVGDDDRLSVVHRFVGHGNRDWVAEGEEYDISLGAEGGLAEGFGYDARIEAYRFDSFPDRQHPGACGQDSTGGRANRCISRFRHLQPRGPVFSATLNHIAGDREQQLDGGTGFRLGEAFRPGSRSKDPASGSAAAMRHGRQGSSWAGSKRMNCCAFAAMTA